MATNYPLEKLRLGFVGSGFIGHFHLRAMIGVRNVEINGVYSPTAANREKLARAVIDSELGQCTAHDSLESLLRAPDVDAIWILSPNFTRLEVMNSINQLVKSGDSGIIAVALSSLIGHLQGNMLEVVYKVANLFTAPLFYLFFMAIFVRRANTIGTWFGSIAGITTAILIAFWKDLFGRQGISFLWIIPSAFIVSAVVGTLVSILLGGNQIEKQFSETTSV